MKNKGLVIVILILVAVLAGASYFYGKNMMNDKGLEQVLNKSVEKNQDKDKKSEAKEENRSDENKENSSKSEEASSESKAPDINIQNEKGEEIKLSSLYNKPVVLNFWATWCGVCRSEMPEFQEAYEKYGKDVNFVMLNVTDGQRETVEGVKKFLEDNKFTFPQYFDINQEGAFSYGLRYLPLTVFINDKGEIVKHQIGRISKEGLEEGIKEISEK